jgi:tetratricopeptide (TPR) repeat protein
MNSVSTDQALHLALSHQKAGRLPEAQAIYQQILAADPHNPHALHLLGTIAMHAGQPQAESLIRAALEHYPDYHEARFNLAVLLLSHNRPAEALPLIEHLIRACGERARPVESNNLIDLEFQYANALRAVGQVRASIPVYRNALAAQPDNVDRLNNLGVALKEDGQFDQAAEIFQQVVQRQPQNAGAWTNLGSTLKELGRLEPAIDAHRHAIAVQADLHQAHCNLANALQAAGRFDQAVKSFQTAITLSPDFAIAYYNFGNCLLEMGRLDQAVTAFL